MMEIFLQPGEYYVGNAGCRVATLLGSCVSITLWHSELRIGAMSHFILATRGVTTPSTLDARYGEEAMALMLRDLDAMRVNPRECQAKLFGGGSMFPGAAGSGVDTVGQKNGEIARMLVRAHEIPIVSESLWGVGHRQIIFDIASGDVWLRQPKLTLGRSSGTA